MATAPTNKPKQNSEEYRVKLMAPAGIRTIEGDIVWDDGANTCIRYKKPGSTNYAKRVVANAKIVGRQGGVGKPSTLYVEESIVVKDFRHAMVEPSKTIGFVLVNYTDTRGAPATVSVRADRCEIIADGVAAPAGSERKPAKTATRAPAKAAATAKPVKRPAK